MLISSVPGIQYDMGGAGMVNYIYVSGRLVKAFGSIRGRQARHSGSCRLILTRSLSLLAKAGVADS